MIVTIGSTKGGTGKSTLSFNLAFALSGKRNIGLIDGDPQGTSAAVVELRRDQQGEIEFESLPAHGVDIEKAAADMAATLDHVVIDVGGKDGHGLRAALACSDLVVIPTPPTAVDLLAVEDMMKLVEAGMAINDRLRAAFVMNRAFARGSDNAEMISILIEDYPDVPVCPVPLVSRKIWSDQQMRGRSVLEPPRNSGAQKEFTAFLKFLKAEGLK